MKALIGGWRQVWNEGDFPFYYVQLAPYNYGGNGRAEPELWEAQTAAQSIPNTGMAVINDIGNLQDIHPGTNRRWAGACRSGPWPIPTATPTCSIAARTFQSMTIDGDKLRLTFDHTGSGLASRDGQPLTWFEIIDADQGGFVKADAQLDGSTVILSAPGVAHPVAMRYAWSMLAEPNLVNSTGLPAGAFRSGTVPVRDLLAMNVPEARDYRLVYDLDLSKMAYAPPTKWMITQRLRNHLIASLTSWNCRTATGMRNTFISRWMLSRRTPGRSGCRPLHPGNFFSNLSPTWISFERQRHGDRHRNHRR